MNEKDDSLYKKRLSKALGVHGFPLEIETHQRLLANKWKSIAESAYTDTDTGKRRTVDFVAWKVQEVDSSISAVDISLVIECKKRSSSAWVFYGEFPDTDEEMKASDLLENATFATISANSDWTNGWLNSAFEKVLGSAHSLVDSGYKIAISGHEILVPEEGKKAKLKDGDKDYLYDACSVVAKAVEEKFSAMVSRWEDRNPDVIQFIYPVIVFEGPMYWVTPSDGNITLEKIQYVQLDWETRYDHRTIDIVHKSWLDDFLEMIDRELANTVSGVAMLGGPFELMMGKIRHILRVDSTPKENKPLNSSLDEDVESK